jgi:hypothetical protein
MHDLLSHASLLLIIVSKNPLSSHGAEFLGLVLDFSFVVGRLPS